MFFYHHGLTYTITTFIKRKRLNKSPYRSVNGFTHIHSTFSKYMLNLLDLGKVVKVGKVDVKEKMDLPLIPAVFRFQHDSILISTPPDFLFKLENFAHLFRVINWCYSINLTFVSYGKIL